MDFVKGSDFYLQDQSIGRVKVVVFRIAVEQIQIVLSLGNIVIINEVDEV